VRLHGNSLPDDCEEVAYSCHGRLSVNGRQTKESIHVHLEKDP
jgi:hypothetical protein